MFTKFAFPSLSVLFLASSVFSSPVSFRPAKLARKDLASRTDFSFNNWNGFQSLNNFDDFYGADNFDGFRNDQTVVFRQDQIVCRVQQVQIVQQRLIILQEMAKRIITEQICEVEVQTIVFQQFHDSMGNFQRDLRHESGKQVGYDSNVADRFRDVFNADGSLGTNDLGFKGHDVGGNTVVVGGSNWNDNTSPASVKAAEDAVNAAKGGEEGGEQPEEEPEEKPEEEKPEEEKPEEEKPEEENPEEEKPEEEKPEEQKPEEENPEEEPAEEKPAEEQPAEEKPAEEQPAEGEPAEGEPAPY